MPLCRYVLPKSEYAAIIQCLSILFLGSLGPRSTSLDDASLAIIPGFVLALSLEKVSRVGKGFKHETYASLRTRRIREPGNPWCPDGRVDHDFLELRHVSIKPH